MQFLLISYLKQCTNAQILDLSFQCCHWHEIHCLCCQVTSDTKQQQVCSPRACEGRNKRSTETFQGCLPREEQKQKAVKSFERKWPQEAAAIYKPSPSREARDSQEVTWELSTKQAHHQRGTSPKKQRPSQEWMLASPMRESWQCN